MTITVKRRERAFQESLSFEGFVEAMQVNRQTFETNYQGYQLSEAEKVFLPNYPNHWKC